MKTIGVIINSRHQVQSYYSLKKMGGRQCPSDCVQWNPFEDLQLKLNVPSFMMREQRRIWRVTRWHSAFYGKMRHRSTTADHHLLETWTNVCISYIVGLGDVAYVFGNSVVMRVGDVEVGDGRDDRLTGWLWPDRILGIRVTFEVELWAFWYVSPPATNRASEIVFQPLALIRGYALMKDCTDWSETSCSRIIRPGVLGPEKYVSFVNGGWCLE